MGRHLARGADQAADGEQARERERIEDEPDEPQPDGERGDRGADQAGEARDPERDRRATDQEPHGRAPAQVPMAGRQETAEPRDRVIAVREISDRQIDGEGEQ